MGPDRLHIQRGETEDDEDGEHQRLEKEDEESNSTLHREEEEEEEDSSLKESTGSTEANDVTIEVETTDTSFIKPSYVAVSYMVGSTISISLMSVLLKKLGDLGYPPFELAFFRSLSILLIVWVCLWLKGLSFIGPPSLRLRLLCVLRGIFGFGGFSSLIYSVLHLPLSDAMTLTYTSPIFTIILARLILKEPIVWLDIIGLICNVCGVLVIEQPKFLFPHSSSSSSTSGSSSFSSSSSSSFSSSSGFFDERSLAVAVSVFGAMSAACAFISVKYIGNSVHPLHLVAYFAIMSTILSTIITFSVETWVLPSTVLEGVALGSIGCFGFIGQILVNMALQKEKAAKMANYGYLSIVWAFLWQILLYGSLSTLSVLGAVLVSGYAVVATLKGSDIEKRITNFLTESWNRWCCRWCGGTGSTTETEEGKRGHQLLVESASVREERGWERESEEGEGDVELQVMERKQQCEEDNVESEIVEVKVKGGDLTVKER